MNAVVRERIHLDPRNKRVTWIEDIEVKYDGRVTYFSVQAESHTDADGNRVIDRVLYDGRPVILPPGIVDMIEQCLEEDDMPPGDEE